MTCSRAIGRCDERKPLRMFQERFSLGGRYLASLPFRACAPSRQGFVSHRYWNVSRRRRRCGRCRPCGRKERAHSDLQNRRERGFAQASTPIIFFREEETRRTNDKRAASVPVQTVSMDGFTPGRCAPFCAPPVCSQLFHGQPLMDMRIPVNGFW